MLVLVEGGLVSLDETLDRWVVDVPHAEQISVRQLLSHTSGLPDYVAEPELLTTLDEPHSASELLSFVADEPLLFTPGTDHRYANSNYLALGLLVEAVTGMPWEDYVGETLVGPLALSDTLLHDPVPDIPGHVGGTDSTGLFHPSNAGAAGQIAANAADVARWGAALYGGAVLTRRSLEAMVNPVPQSADESEGYGLGTMILADGGEVYWGNSGSIIGFQSRLRVRSRDGLVIASLVDDFAAEADEVDALLRGALAEDR